LELMKDIPDESIDLVLTDPPFAIKFKGRRNNYYREQIEYYRDITKYHKKNIEIFHKNGQRKHIEF